MPADCKSPRERLRDSLDVIFAAQLKLQYQRGAVKCKLFGIGSESYVVRSHEFCLGYPVQNGTMLCLDTGHFHPTEAIMARLEPFGTLQQELSKRG